MYLQNGNKLLYKSLVGTSKSKHFPEAQTQSQVDVCIAEQLFIYNEKEKKDKEKRKK